MFNHSTRDLDAQCITYTVLRDITKGEELCISYGSGRLWFEDVEGQEVSEHDPGQTLGELELAGLGGCGLMWKRRRRKGKGIDVGRR
jgi:uncharacterized protein